MVLKGVKPSTAFPESRAPFEDSVSLVTFGLFPFPTNPAARTSGSLVSRLSVIDPRFSLACYGSFLDEIPRRLGNNAALDASVDALTCSFANLATKQSSPQSITKYGNALSALRLCLNDPVKSKTPETLCAIYFVLISEVSISMVLLEELFGVRICSNSFSLSRAGLEKWLRTAPCRTQKVLPWSSTISPTITTPHSSKEN